MATVQHHFLVKKRLEWLGPVAEDSLIKKGHGKQINQEKTNRPVSAIMEQTVVK